MTDEEYAAFKRAGMTHQELEALVREIPGEVLAKRLQSMGKGQRSPSQQKVSEILHHAGLTSSMPTGCADFEEVERERDRLADILGRAGGKPASEMVINHSPDSESTALLFQRASREVVFRWL